MTESIVSEEWLRFLLRGFILGLPLAWYICRQRQKRRLAAAALGQPKPTDNLWVLMFSKLPWQRKTIQLGDPELSDVTFIVEQQEFSAHRMILANSSDVFKAMLYGKFKEADEDTIEIKDTTADSFRRLLEIVYSGQVSDPEVLFFRRETIEVHPFGERFDPSIGVAEHCEEQDKNAIYYVWSQSSNLLQLADRLNLTERVENCLRGDYMNVCCRKDCIYCLNYAIFALENDLAQPKFACKMTKDAFKNWTEQSDDSMQLSAKTMKFLMSLP